MIRAYLSQAANWSGAELLGKDAEFMGVSIDSRRVSPGSLFVALKGAHLDGHDFLDDAKLRGASGALVSSTVNSSLPVLLTQDPLSALGKLATTWRQNFDLPVVSVLGSNGKTTVKEMTTAILRFGQRASGPLRGRKS